MLALSKRAGTVVRVLNHLCHHGAYTVMGEIC